MLIPRAIRDLGYRGGNVLASTGKTRVRSSALTATPTVSARSGTDVCLHRDLVSCFQKLKENGSYDNRQTCGMRRRKQVSRKPTVVHWGQASCFRCYLLLT